MAPITLAQRIWLLVVGVVVTAACLTAGVAWWSARTIVLGEVDGDLRYEAERFAHGRSDRGAPRSMPGRLREGLEWRILFAQGDEPERSSSQWPALANELPAFAVIVALDDGQRRWRAMQLHVDRAALDDQQSRPPDQHSSDREQRRWERRRQLLQRREAALQGAVIQVAVEVTELHAELRRLAWLLFAVVAGISALAMVVAGTVRDAVLAPLARLSGELTRLDDASLTARSCAEPLPPELQRLQDRINALLDRLALVREAERRTLANMAHELRTPLAAMATALSFARDDQDRQRLIPDMQEQVALLARRCEALLMLSRADAGALTPQLQALSVSELLADAWASLGSLQQQPDVALDVDDPHGAEIAADPHLAAMVMENMLRNALSHGSSPNHIVVRVQPSDRQGYWQIYCENPLRDGDPEALEACFQPFWRADRSRHDSQHHAGLGLPLVARLLALHGGHCHASLQGQSSRFRLTLEWPQG